MISHIDRISPRGVVTPEIQAFLESSRVAIRRTMAESCHRVTDTLAIYDEAYEGMTKKGDPLRFRDFLRKAPSLFTELGERLGAIDHVISFWRFRFPSTERALITPEELSDIFSDFQQSLSITVRSQAA